MVILAILVSLLEEPGHFWGPCGSGIWLQHSLLGMQGTPKLQANKNIALKLEANNKDIFVLLHHFMLQNPLLHDRTRNLA